MSVREQADTHNVSTKTIMSSRRFASGLAAIRGGKPFDPDIDDWGYERGRLFGAIAPLDMLLRIDGKLNPNAISLFDAASRRGYLI
jgi:hypothetical protein